MKVYVKFVRGKVKRSGKVFFFLHPLASKQWNLSKATKQWNLPRAIKQWNFPRATK
jgi:hypothetical protein